MQYILLPCLTLPCLRTCMIDRYAALNATTQEGDLAEFEFREKRYVFSLRMYCTLGEIWIWAEELRNCIGLPTVDWLDVRYLERGRELRGTTCTHSLYCATCVGVHILQPRKNTKIKESFYKLELKTCRTVLSLPILHLRRTYVCTLSCCFRMWVTNLPLLVREYVQ